MSDTGNSLMEEVISSLGLALDRTIVKLGPPFEWKVASLVGRSADGSISHPTGSWRVSAEGLGLNSSVYFLPLEGAGDRGTDPGQLG